MKGSAYGYYVQSKKTWLVKEEYLVEQARDLFKDTRVMITSRGQPYLGAHIGSDEYEAEMNL